MVFLIGKCAYTLAYEHKNGWNAEVFRERYSEILERYDYIVGDWGYNQLRLRGFYKEGHPRAPKDSIITSLVDYIQEYCNFGCAYFVLAKTDVDSVPPGTPDLLAGKDAGTGVPDGISGKQTAETAAASASHNGYLMRWPIKERTGGPAWMPGAAAVARAAEEAEKRHHQAQAQAPHKSADSRPAAAHSRPHTSGGRSSARHTAGSGAGKPQGGGSAAGQAEHRGKQKYRGPRFGHGDRYLAADSRSGSAGSSWRQSQDAALHANPDAAGVEADFSAAERTDGGKSAGRWSGKNRRRPRYGGKPNRPEGQPQREPDGTARPGPE